MKDQIKIWIDALEFQEIGGWKTDTQYVHLMGCGYLLAADAKTVINVPKKDTYRIWIRTRNWLRPHNPGRFSLLVNGEDNKVVLGAQPSDAWVLRLQETLSLTVPLS